MITREYEVVYIFESTLEDDAIKSRLDRFHGMLNAADATVDHWGRRQLAYKIGPRETGYYAIARFATEPSLLPEYERALKLDEGVVRFLVTLHEHELGAPPMTEEQLAAKKKDDDDDDED